MKTTESPQQTCEKRDEIEREALRLMTLGLDVLPLEPRSKETFAANWPAAAPHTAKTFMTARKPGGNIGLRTGRRVGDGFLHVLDFDVDEPTPDALAALHELVPADVLPLCPTVVSGNASGQRRHFYVIADAPMAKTTRTGTWGKIELMGFGQQVVLPPSIHPASGRPYRWERPLPANLDLASLLGGDGDIPRIPVERCRAWGARRAEDLPVDGDPEEWALRQSLEQSRFSDDLASGKLQSALDAIGPEQILYDGYFGVLGALHFASGGDLDAREMARECVNRSWWYQSALTGAPIDPAHPTLAGTRAKIRNRTATTEDARRELDKTWSRLKLDHRNPTMLGTVYALARANGWTWERSKIDIDAAMSDDEEPEPDAKAEATPDPSPLRLLAPVDCEAAPPRGYVVKGLLAPGDLAMIFGQPGTGKSLLAPYLGYMVALGDPVGSVDAPAHPGEREGDGPTAPRVFGMRTKRTGPVLYFAAEDPAGMRGRIKALRRRHGDAPDFRLVVGGTNLMPGGGDLIRMRAIVKELRPSLIFIDTLQIAFPAGAMEAEKEAHYGVIVRAGRALAAQGAAVVLIHHPPKSGDTPRGSGVLNGALDVSILIERGEDGVVRAAGGVLPKNRNGSPRLDLAFRVEVEDGGVDSDGDRITLPVCHPLPPADAAFRDLAPAERKALDVLRGLVADASNISHSAVYGISEEAWRSACCAPAVLSGSPDAGTRGRVFRRARTGLADKGRTRADNGLVYENSIDPDDLPATGQSGQSADSSGMPAAASGGRRPGGLGLPLRGVRSPVRPQPGQGGG